MTRILLLSTAAAAALLTGCTVGPDFKRPTKPTEPGGDGTTA